MLGLATEERKRVVRIKRELFCIAVGCVVCGREESQGDYDKFLPITKSWHSRPSGRPRGRGTTQVMRHKRKKKDRAVTKIETGRKGKRKEKSARPWQSPIERRSAESSLRVKREGSPCSVRLMEEALATSGMLQNR